MEPAGRLARCCRLVQVVKENARKLIKYGATSIVALGVSETVLLTLYGSGVLNATADAFIGNLAGTVPSYLMSRYWVWRTSARNRVGRQVVLYWMTSLTSMVLTSVATGAVAEVAPPGHFLHLLVVGTGFVAVSLTLWVTKFLVYEHLIFLPGAQGHVPAGESAPGPSDARGVLAMPPLADQGPGGSGSPPGGDRREAS